VAVFERSNGNWYILSSATGNPVIINWGWTAAIPVPADYDGDGIVDIGVFNPADGTWYLRLSATGNVHVENWGWSDVTPVRVR
jgi:hypothetical protein